MSKLEKLLYIDLPFAGEKGGDKNRSKFLWKTLSSHFHADLLLINSSKSLDLRAHTGCERFYHLDSSPGGLGSSPSIFYFSDKVKQQYRKLLLDNQYDIIFVRSAVMGDLAIQAADCLAYAKIIVDSDMLFSRLAQFAWEANRALSNRYYFIESIKLRRFEQRLYSRPFLFYFANPLEKNLVNDLCRGVNQKSDYRILPNFLKLADNFKPNPQRLIAEKFILFFGTLNSAANVDAYQYLVKEIYPRIEKVLQQTNRWIYIAGKNETDLYRRLILEKQLDRIQLLGEVDDLNELISQAEFVFLPIRIGTGTRTRVLESAVMKKAVITTPMGAEGLELNEKEIIIRNRPEQLAEWLIKFIQEPKLADYYGEKLYQRATTLYEESVVADKLVQEIQTYQPRRMKVAIITNRFYPEVGGVETNLNFQAMGLSKNYDLTVLCPRRITGPARETRDGFKVLRFYDWLNPFNRFPNLKAKTLCPGIYLHLRNHRYDMVQCFPSINYNNRLAFHACKPSRIPFIFCSFDFLDYGEIIKKEGKISGDLLKTHHLKPYEKEFLKHCDHIFAISNKEIELFNQYNPNVEYSPVPILPDEYEAKVTSPRSKYGITEQEFVFLSLGRVSNIKGQDILLKAFAAVQEDLPGARLVFVGRHDYEPAFVQAMYDFIREQGIEQKVVFTGMVQRDEVLGWLRYADIHVIPVRFMNSGAVVVETWISETPVIQSDVVDPNLVVEGENGYLFDSESVDSLKRVLLSAYREKEKFAQMAANGKALVLQKYTYEYLISLYTRAYRDILSRRR